jgi:hypothetical protein
MIKSQTILLEGDQTFPGNYFFTGNVHAGSTNLNNYDTLEEFSTFFPESSAAIGYFPSALLENTGEIFGLERISGFGTSLTSPNGTPYTLFIDDDGVLFVTEAMAGPIMYRKTRPILGTPAAHAIGLYF